MAFAECRYSTSSTRQFKSHMHKTFSLGAVDRGEVVYTVGERESRLAPGSLALINPEAMHSCNTVGLQERSYYMLYLDVDWCLQVQRSLWEVECFRQVSKIHLESEDLYNRYIATMTTLMDSSSHLLEKEQQLVDLATTLFSLACPPKDSVTVLADGVDCLRQQLGSNLKADLTLDSLASEIGANPYTLLRKFKKVTGLTPHAYRMNCRIEKAKEYLQQGEDIADTALECGFFDQSHMHRHFKAMTTVTPSEYRVNFIQ
jgi:AraC-like DNA-binding protein